jgi:hypothetical protein
VRDAKYNAAIRHALSQHGRYRTPKQLARNAKNPGKTRVLQHGLQKTNGEDRNRTFRCFPNVSGMFERYLLTLAYADNKPVAVARLGECLDFQGLERDYKSIRSAEIA